MSRVLPILFNSDMIQAILDGRKRVTRRAVKYKYSNTEMRVRTDKYGTSLIEIQKDIEGETYGKKADGRTWHKLLPYIEKNPQYRPGDILYVRETWTYHEGAVGGIIYKARCPKKLAESKKWHPSIHMPKKVARIWLKVTDVRVEKLQEISGQGVLKEGVNSQVHPESDYFYENQREMFKELWNSTIKKTEQDLYGWDADPWVWVIEFERCEKPEGC